ncbi:MAG TPA: Xaa-Pro peptidase family protein [Blastocatellia bacterium]|nr:Xaa-Pro peptidase family protein [Blastocatellia bacterium]
MIEKIQQALKEADLDGWLFYSFRESDPIAANILGTGGEGHIATRRWYYLVPRAGEPTKIVHSIERDVLDHLPGRKQIYLPWQQLHERLKGALGELASGRPPRVAMQYSPEAAIPYLSRVDAGTVELIRSFGVEIVSSADLVQKFESAWNDEQLAMHDEAARGLYKTVHEAFGEIGRRVRAGEPTTEYDIQQFILGRFGDLGLITRDPPIVAVNANSAMPHYEPTREKHSPIRAGDFVLIDLWAKVNRPGSVYADITWTSVVSDAVPNEVNKVFTTVRDARDAAVAFVKEAFSAGRTIYGWEVDDACRAVIQKAGYGEYFIHRTGHNIHTEVHGNGANIDNLETRDNRVLIPRTCFSIEPGIYLEGRFGVRSEIDMYVDEGAARVTGGEPQREVVRILA